MSDPHTIIVHCSATHPDWMEGETLWQKRQEIRRWHVDRNGWSDIGYHWLIDRNGQGVQGREWTRQGAHVRGHNRGTIGICLIGGHGSDSRDDFSDHFTPEQDEALRAKIEELRRMFPSIERVAGHNEFAAKACPGFLVPEWYATAPEVRPVPFDMDRMHRLIDTIESAAGEIRDMMEGM
jgi:N-acetyl-anhydromuramyl-L-alanine amidase AmpD